MAKNNFLYTLLVLIVTVFTLASCTTWSTGSRFHYWGSRYEEHGEHRDPGMPAPLRAPAKPSYHFSSNSTPASHKHRDLDWVKQQSNSNYTVEIAHDSRANVAKQLHKTPRSGRQAQFKSRDGNYVGVMGSYKSKEEAEQALNRLPANVRSGAKVKQWDSVKPAE